MELKFAFPSLVLGFEPRGFFIVTIKRNDWTAHMLRVDDHTCPAGASDLRREDLAPRASRHDRGGTEFLFFNSGPCRGARFFSSRKQNSSLRCR
ncbi:hypothetical protein SBA2_250039 [Acidobacteriia bacterium SbA2]|nr:hypothetical protein SBA2_250039 [Acidobacteriia bacterium SbA2]